MRDGISEDGRSGENPKQPEDSALPFDFDLPDYLPYQLARAQLAMYRLLNPETNPDLMAIAALSKGDIRVLTLIAGAQADSPSDIAQIMSLDRAVVTRHVSALSRAGLVVNLSAKDDRRRRMLCLTDKGRRFSTILFPIFQDFSERIDGWITAREKKTLMTILAKLLERSSSS